MERNRRRAPDSYMPHIPIRAVDGEDSPTLYFPLPSDGKLMLDDLRGAFPLIMSLRFTDGDDRQLHVLCRDGMFVKPDDGWLKEGRIYLAVSSASVTGQKRFGSFESFRRQVTSRPREERKASSRTQSEEKKSQEPSSTMITVGHGHFRGGRFSKISATSLCGQGGLVNVGPFSKIEDCSDDIRRAAFQKFCAQNRGFRQRYKRDEDFYLVYPDGSVVKMLPDKSAVFSLKGYRDFLDPRKRYDRIRLYLCERSNHDGEMPFDLITDSSSADELPALSTRQTSTTTSNSTIFISDPNTTTSNSTVINISNSSNDTDILASAAGTSNTTNSTSSLTEYRNVTDSSGITLSTETPENHSDNTTDHEEVEVKNTSAVPAYEHTSEVMDQIVDSVLRQLGNTSEPTTILRVFAEQFNVGRQLDISDTTTFIEGGTSPIYLSRTNLWNDVFLEVPHIENLRFPLEVNFFGESAADYGGPRREFFSLFIDATKTNLVNGDCNIVSNEEYLSTRKYYWSGIILGLSMIQGGPLPTFLDSVLSGELCEELQQLKDGLAKVGIIQMLDKKPTLRYLLRPSAQPSRLTVSRLINLFSVDFAPEGSTQRAQQEMAYRNAITYMREVYAGRRGDVSLEKILKFATGVDVEPILGFTMNPRLVFVDEVMPTANTCVCELRFPKNADFSKLDMAFLSDYFGFQ